MNAAKIKQVATRTIRAAQGLSTLEWSSREARQRVQRGSLLHWGSNVYSQRGDDGIIREIFRRLGVSRGTFVEFGAWDGVYLSNTRFLFERGWSGLYIEGDPKKSQELKKRYASTPDIRCAQGMVTAANNGTGKTLDKFCDENGLAEHVDFVSIDIDGLDLNIFESLRRKPTVVCIEGGFSWHPEMTSRVPDAVAARGLQQPLAVSIESVRSRGYEPICFNQNMYAVRAEHAKEFGGINSDAVSLWLDAYYDRSVQFRTRLANFRKNNELICATERKFESAFTITLEI